MSDEAFNIAASGMEAQRVAMDEVARQIAGTGAAVSTASQRSFEFVPASFSGALDTALAIGGPDDVGGLPGDDGSAGDEGFANDNGLAMVQADEWATGVNQRPWSGTTERAGATSSDDQIGAMISLISAGRAYDANVASLQAAKQMDVEASDIDKY
jgi:flagellar basal body rod protein FlgC